MVRSKIIANLCNQNPNLSRKDIEKILELIFSEMIEALKRNEMVQIRGWGVMKTVKRKARTGINPKTGEKNIQIPEKKAIKWKMSKIFFNRLNKNFTENEISDTY